MPSFEPNACPSYLIEISSCSQKEIEIANKVARRA